MRLNELLTEKARPRRLGLVMAVALGCAAPLALAQGMLIKGAAAPLADLGYSHALLDQATLTSAFGARTHPITKKPGWHNGVDLAAPEGAPVYAPTGGTVTLAAMKEGYGNLVVLKGVGDRQFRFGQLQEMKVKEGDIVAAGEVIGLVGQTGAATGPHLHFEVWHGEKPDDPMSEDGLELAESLFIMSSAGVKAPLPPAPPAGQQPLNAPAPPATPTEGQRSILAPDVPVPAGQPSIPAAAPAAPAAPEMPAACKAFDDFLAAPVTEAAWVSRKTAAVEANKAAGLNLASGWAPRTLAHPMPFYPAPAATEGLSGACKVMFDLGTDGLPKNMLAECSDPVFADSATELNGAVFEPATGADGKPVEVKGVIYPLQYCIS